MSTRHSSAEGIQWGAHIYACCLHHSEAESTKTGGKRSGTKLWEITALIFLSRLARAAVQISQATVVVSQASTFFSTLWFIHKLTAPVRQERPWHAAIFNSYGNQTRRDRFIPVSTASLKKRRKSRSMVGMHAHCRRRQSLVSHRSAVALRFFPALSC